MKIIEVRFPSKKLLKKIANKLKVERTFRDFPGGAVVKNPPANAGNTGWSPGPGRSHVPWIN